MSEDTLLFLENHLNGLCASEISGREKGIVTEGCRQLAVAASGQAYEGFVDRMLARFLQPQTILPEDVSLCGMGRSLLWAYRRTGDDRCMQAAKSLAGLLRRSEVSTVDAELLYLTQPFFVEYETICNNKAGYHEAVMRMTEAAAAIEGVCSMQMGWYLLALSDVIECMSIEIYEHYRTLAELLKQSVKAYLRADDGAADIGTAAQAEFPAMLGYAILKSCKLGCLNPEKYRQQGIRLAKSLLQRDASGDDARRAALRMLLLAQLSPKERIQAK